MPRERQAGSPYLQRLHIRSAGIGQIAGSSLDMNFAGRQIFGAPSFASAIAMTRATTNGLATAEKLDGSIVQFADNELRMTDNGWIIEQAGANGVRNGAFSGATVGVIGSGGVLPTNCALFATAGLSTEIISVRQENGFDIFRFRIFGTTNSIFYVLALDNPGATAADGQTWTESLYAAIAGGSMTGVSVIYTNLRQTGGGNGTTDVAFSTLTNKLVRQPSAYRPVVAGLTAVIPAIYINLANATAVDLTLDIAAPQIKQGAFPLSYIRASGSAASRGVESPTLNSPITYATLAQGGAYGEFVDILGPISVARRVWSYRVDANNSIHVEIGTDNKLHFIVTNAGVAQCDLVSTNAIVKNGVYKFAVRWANNDYAARYSAALGSPANDTSGTMPTGSPTFGIGHNGAGGNQLNSYLRRLALFSTGPSDARLDQLVL